MAVYRALHTGPNTQFGGFQLGFFRVCSETHYVFKGVSMTWQMCLTCMTLLRGVTEWTGVWTAGNKLCRVERHAKGGCHDA